MAFPVPSNTVQFVQALDGSMKIRITDTTEWVANGITLNSLEIFIQVTSPDGNIFHPINLALPDIDPDVSRSVEFTCPNDAQGNPQTGDYLVLEYAESSIGPSTYTTTNVAHNLCTDYPTLCIQDVPDCIYMFLTVRDVTLWTTNGFTVDSRTFTLYYPQGAGPSPIVTVSDTITTPDLWIGGAYTAVLEVTVTNGNYTTSLVYRKNFEANCMSGADLCTLVCVLNKVQLQTESRNLTVAADAESRYSKMVDLMTHITAAAKCGMGTQLDNLLDDFYTLGGATRNCDCGCTDSSGPTVLVPIHPGGGGSVVQIVVAAGPGIAVAYNSGTATYTVSMSAANVALLASLYNTVVAAGAGITVTSATVGIETTYTVAVTNPVKDSIKWTQKFEPRTGLGGGSMSAVQVVGSSFANGPVTLALTSGNFYTLSGFVASGTPLFHAKMEIRSIVLTPAWVGPAMYHRLIDIKQFYDPYASNPTSLMFGFVDSNMQARTLAWFSTYLESFEVDFEIERIN